MPSGIDYEILESIISELSVPSNAFTIADVPEVKNFKTEFEYFGYEINEGISNRSGGTRSVKVTFSSVQDTSDFRSIAPVAVLSIPSNDDIVEFLSNGNFIDESRSSRNTFIEILLQDVFSEEKSAQLFTSALSGLNVQTDSLSPTEGTSVIKNKVLEDFPDTEFTISDDVVASLIQQGFVNESIPESNAAVSQTFEGVNAGIQILNSCDNRISGNVVRASAANTLTAFSDNFSWSQAEYDTIQAAARADFLDDGAISEESYVNATLPAATVEYGEFVSMPLHIGDAIVLGYYVEKFVVLEDGSSTYEEGFYIEQPAFANGQTVTLSDDRISLGSTYAYSISTIAIADIPNIDVDDDGSKGTSSFITKSRVQTSVITTGIGYPQPPVDVEYFYDTNSGNLSITWSPNPESLNIVKYQIFRRKSVNEPFALIRQYDFDNSTEQFENAEQVDYGLNVKLDRELLFYIDEDFRSTETYIYALCAINSAGGSSPYSAQAEVRLNQATGDIYVQQISPEGAPKPYPNFYLDEQLTSELGQVTGAKSATIYFTPEVFNTTKNEFDPITGEVISEEDIIVFRTNGDLQNNGEYLLEMTELQTLQRTTDSIIVNAGAEASGLFTS